jgi:hypothetical protein
MVLPFVLMLVLLAVIMYVLGYVVGGVAGGLVGSVVVTGVMVGVLYRKFARMKNGTVVHFSEYGVELTDTLGFRIRLLWPDITRIGQVNSRMASPEAVGGDLQVSVGEMKSRGIIGWGDRVVPPNAPGWMRENLAAQPRHPYDGRPEVAIPLGGIDPNWAQGPMGHWVRMYRPDLFGVPGYPQSYPQQRPY